MAAADPRKAAITAAIRVIPDFPKKGIMFQDVSTLLLDPAAFQAAIDMFVERYRQAPMDVQCVAGELLRLGVCVVWPRARVEWFSSWQRRQRGRRRWRAAKIGRHCCGGRRRSSWEQWKQRTLQLDLGAATAVL